MTWSAMVLRDCLEEDVDPWSGVVPVDGPETVALVGCTKTKHDPGDGQTLPAPQLYEKSDYFSKTWELAGQVADYRWILSAEHALVWPEDELEYYETFLGDLDDEEYAELVREVGWQLGGLVGGTIPVGAEIVVLAGKDYVQLVDDALAPSDAVGSRDKREWVHLSTPLQDHVEGGIGAQRSWLKDQIEQRRPTQQATLGEVLAQ